MGEACRRACRHGQLLPLPVDPAPLSGSDSEAESVNEPTRASDDAAHDQERADQLEAMAQEEAEKWEEDHEQEWEEDSGSV